jgi:hypothetical protein
MNCQIEFANDDVGMPCGNRAVRAVAGVGLRNPVQRKGDSFKQT